LLSGAITGVHLGNSVPREVNLDKHRKCIPLWFWCL
jgi:hypothetical protein